MQFGIKYLRYIENNKTKFGDLSRIKKEIRIIKESWSLLKKLMD